MVTCDPHRFVNGIMVLPNSDPSSAKPKYEGRDRCLRVRSFPLSAGFSSHPPPEFEVAWTAGQVSLKAGKAARIRLSYRLLCPGWPAGKRPLLRRRGVGVVRHASWKDDQIEWQATPGEYVLLPGPP